MSTKILFIGATGYLGGSTLLRLLKHPKRDNFDISILLRATSKAQAFQSYVIKTVIGSLTDYDILEREASQADVVFQSADADDLPATHAILKGLKKRFETTGIAPALIHSSGTGVLVDNAYGKYATETIYSDLDISQIEALPITQMHRNVDVTVTEAGKEGYANTYIVFPSTIYGMASNGFTDKGLQNRTSKQIPALVDFSIKRGKTAIVGEGLNIWPHVELEETIDFYVILFDAIISGKNPANGREGFYYLENGEYTHKQVAEAVAKALYKLHKVDSDQPVILTEAEHEAVPMAKYLGTNCRCTSERSRSLGWKPLKGTEDLMASIEPEVINWVQTTSQA